MLVIVHFLFDFNEVTSRGWGFYIWLVMSGWQQ
jgi:hypothetical protein